MVENIKYGTSFSPEYSEYLGCKQPLDLLKIIQGELNMKDIRFGLRWNRVDSGDGISLDYYRKYIDFLLKNNCKICLNIGPIKVFRWPEEHIPSYISQKGIRKVSHDCELAKYSYEYLFNLLKLLSKEYGSKLNSVTFQLENEPFFKFGHIPMIMSSEYVLELTKIFHNLRPNSKLLFNSAGRRNLKQIVKFFYSVRSKYGIEGKSLILGLNYYFKVPKRIPIFNSASPIGHGNLWDMSIKELHKEQRKFKFGLEISEGQFEPWGKQKTPGNSIEDLEYLTQNCKIFFPDGYTPQLIRLWGTEELALKILNGSINEVHKKLIENIQLFQGF